MEATITQIQQECDIKNWWESVVQDANCSPFVSWMWIGPWLSEITSKENAPFLVKIIDQNEIVAIGLLHMASVVRHGTFKRKILFLNELPLNGDNMVIEYNGLAVKKGYEEKAWCCLFAKLHEFPHWDEFHINAISRSTSVRVRKALIHSSSFLSFKSEKKESIFYADLGEFDSWSDVELSVFSKNKRAQINRSIRAYQSKYGGNLICEKATTVDKAMAFFNKMGVLHTTYWNSKGSVGAFANDKWIQFNKSIIERSLESGLVEMYRISINDFDIGYVYNFVWRDIAFNIQSGFTYHQDNKFKPGYVCHYLIMKSLFEFGLKKYNFLFGSTHYKKSLSNASDSLEWLVVRKRADYLKFLIEDQSLKFMRKIKKLLKAK